MVKTFLKSTNCYRISNLNRKSPCTLTTEGELQPCPAQSRAAWTDGCAQRLRDEKPIKAIPARPFSRAQ